MEPLVVVCPGFGDVQDCNSEQSNIITTETCTDFERQHDKFTLGSLEQLHCKLAHVSDISSMTMLICLHPPAYC